MKVLQIPVGQMANFTYIVADEETDEAVIIDPSWDLEKVFDALKKNGWKAKYVINTHSHFDHVLGNEQVTKVTKAKIIQHKASQLEKDVAVSEGDTIRLGSIEMKVVHTPGHSKDSICLVLDGVVFTGDTLFVGSCGRVGARNATTPSRGVIPNPRNRLAARVISPSNWRWVSDAPTSSGFSVRSTVSAGRSGTWSAVARNRS